jgi:hypothetical protein
MYFMDFSKVKDHKTFLGGLIAGFTTVSLIAYILQDTLPDLVSAISFTAVFTVVWFALDKVSLFN